MSQIIIIILTILISAVTAGLITFIYTTNKKDKELKEVEGEKAEIEEKLNTIEKEKIEIQLKLTNKIEKLEEEKKRIREETIVEYENKMSLIKKDQEKEKALILKEMEEAKKSFEQRLNFIEETKKKMILEFKDLSEKIVKEQNSNNREKVNEILLPLREQLNNFKEQVNTVYDRESKDRSMLKQELIELKEWNNRISQETSKLTRALKGDNKILGNWGEMVLDTVLSNSGLREGIEYKREVSLKDNQGNMFRPDVVVSLPDDRDVIIDAKTSLTAYEQYINTGDEKYLKEHITSIKTHIKNLSDKKYDKLEGINSLDFVFMFLPIESSLSIALEEDKELFDKAYKSNIFLVSPSTLLMALKTVENTWKHKRQEENVKKIVNKAGTLYDKFVGFLTDMEKLGDQLKTLNKTYDNATNKLKDGNGNIIKQIDDLKKMGANTSKQITLK